LGVPTIGDRIAQTVVAGVLEAKAEPVFHPDSYGYRPGRSAIDAVGRCRERCWKADWVIDLDIRAFFDSVPWDLVLKAVAAHTDPSQSWVLLYVRRWLAAPLQLPDGTRRERDRGIPQGSSVSPVLANLFLHYAFDVWMARSRAPASVWIVPAWGVDLGGGPRKQVNTAPVDHGVLYASRSTKVPCSFLHHPLSLPPCLIRPAWKPSARAPPRTKSAAW
jgi:retron-type reverse transcriptase